MYQGEKQDPTADRLKIHTFGFVQKKLMECETFSEYEEIGKWIFENCDVDRRNYPDVKSVGRMLSTIEFGMQMGYGWHESISQLIPAHDGRYIMKGDLAKARCFAYGSIAKWEESTSGSVEKGDFVATITASRHNGYGEPISMTRSFSLQKAIAWELYDPKAGTKVAAKRKFWQIDPERMCYYRVLGHLCRDLFADILRNIVLHEEYQDYDYASVTKTEVEGKVFTHDTAADNEKKTSEQSTKLAEGHNGEKDPFEKGPIQKASEEMDKKSAVLFFNVNTEEVFVVDLKTAESSDEYNDFANLGLVDPKDEYTINCMVEAHLDEIGEKTKEVSMEDFSGLTGPEMLKKIEEVFAHKPQPHSLAEYANAIPQRKTQKALTGLLDAYFEDPDVLYLYFLKTYGEEAAKQFAPAKDEGEHEESQNDPEQPETELPEEDDNVAEIPEPSKKEGNVLGIEWPEIKKTGHRPFGLLVDIQNKILAQGSGKYNELNKLVYAKQEGEYEDFDDALASAPAKVLDEVINEAFA